jgi:Protein of unknown function (DUF992)
MKWLLTAAICILAAPAFAQVQTNIGTLTCTLAEAGEKGETPPSQTRAMLCTFKPEGTGPEEHYTGEIQKVGSQSSLSDEPVLIWIVMGPDKRALEPGLLDQTYVGELAPSPDGKAQAPKMLIGKSNKDYGLRPMTDSSGEASSGSVTVVVLKVKNIPA